MRSTVPALLMTSEAAASALGSAGRPQATLAPLSAEHRGNNDVSEIQHHFLLSSCCERCPTAGWQVNFEREVLAGSTGRGAQRIVSGKRRVSVN
jgi:hypothetical protein